jgi:hypothetical protein
MATTMFRAAVLAFSLASVSVQATPIHIPTADLAGPEWSTQAVSSDTDFANVFFRLEAEVLSLPRQTVTDGVMPKGVPEPPTSALIGLALCTFIFLRRRRQN